MKNIGSITAIYYALASDIVSIASPDGNGKVDIGFASGKSLSTFTFTPESASFNEEQQDNDAGPFFVQELSFRCPQVGTVQHAILGALIDRELILAATDGNGNTVIMGSPDAPARVSLKMLRPAAPSGYNGYEVRFSASSVDPAPFMDESFVLS